MANQTITGLSTIASPSSAALLWITDVLASPQDRSFSLANLVAFLPGRLPFVDNISGSKSYGAFSKDTRVVEAAAGTIDITAGATAAGIKVEIVNKYAAGITLNVTTSATSVTMGIGSLALVWDGTQWCKIGGSTFVVKYSTNGVSTFKTPWSGTYDFVGQGAGGGGGGAKAGNPGNGIGGGGGAGGRGSRKASYAAGVSITVTVGQGGLGGLATPAAGGTGGTTSVNDGTVTMTATGGTGGQPGNNSVGANGTGGTTTNDDSHFTVAVVGQSGMNGLGDSSTSRGANSEYGYGQSTSPSSNGLPGLGNGSGGSGAFFAAALATGPGGAGADGLVSVVF